MMSGSSIVPLLIACGFRASFPVGLAWVVTRLLSRSSAATRHFTWACAIGIAALLPIMTVAMPHWSVSTPAPLTRLASPPADRSCSSYSIECCHDGTNRA